MSRDRISAVGLPDPTAEIWTAQTDATEAGPRAGLPVPTADTLLALTTSGEQTAPIEVQTARGGLPVRDAQGTAREVVQAAGMLWRPTGGDWRGWDPPRTMSRWEPVLVETGSGGSYAIDPDVVVADSGAIVVACEIRDATAGPWRLAVRRKTPGGSWATVSIESFAADPAYNFRPTILKLPSGRLHVYRYLLRGAYSGLRWWYSDDDGATWEWGGDGSTDTTLRDDAGNGPNMMRARYNQGQVLLIARLGNVSGVAALRQFASSDLGNHFQFLEDASSALGAFSAAPGRFDIAPRYTGGFAVAVLGLLAGNQPHVFLLPDAYRRLSAVTGDNLTTTVQARIAIAADESGGLLLITGRTSDASTAWGSMDGGATWSTYYTGSAAGAEDSTYYPAGIDVTDDWTLALGRGRGHLVHGWSTSSYTLSAKLGIAYLGGWATVTQPLARQSDSDFDSIGWYQQVLPAARPDDYDNVASLGVLTATVGLVGSATTVIASTGQNAAWGFDLASVTADNRATQWRLVGRVSAGGSLSALRAGMQIVVADIGAPTIRSVLEIRQAVGGWRLWDAQAGAQIGADVTHATGVDVEILVSVEANGRIVSTWWREVDGSEDKEYTAGPTGTYTDGATPLTQRCSVGVFSGDTTATTMRITEWSMAVGFTTGSARIISPVTTGTLTARLVAGRPYLGRGVYLQARQGPSWRGEQWTIDPDPDFGLDRALLDPSPRNGWRSTSTAAQEIAIQWTAQRSPVLAVMLRGSNVPEVQVEAWNGSGWDVLGTAVLRSTLPFTRSGSTIRPNGEGPAYLAHGDAAGGWVSLSSTVGRAVQHQTEGAWSTARYPRASIVLEDVAGGDPASGTGALVWPDAVIYVDLGDRDATAIRLTVPAAASSLAPPEAYWRIGTIACRWLWPLGSEHAWGEVEETVTHVEGDRTRDRQWRGVQVAPASRRASLTFSVVSESGLDSTPEVVRAGSSRVAEQATARALAAYLRELEGPAGSLLYVPDLPAGDLGGSVTVALGRRAGLLGRMIEGRMSTTEQEGSTRSDRMLDAGQIVIEEDP